MTKRESAVKKLFAYLTASMTNSSTSKDVEVFTPSKDDVLIKSRERVRQYGEVFTPSKTINDMLNLVPELNTEDALYNVDTLAFSVFEPSCGTGNFLVEILNRKLQLVYKLPHDDLYKNILIAVSSLYGVDIQEDNVTETRERLFKLIIDFNDTHSNVVLSDCLLSVVRYILKHNIIFGNTLTYESLDDPTLSLTVYKWDFTINDDCITAKMNGYYLFNLDVCISYKDVEFT